MKYIALFLAVLLLACAAEQPAKIPELPSTDNRVVSVDNTNARPSVEKKTGQEKLENLLQNNPPDAFTLMSISTSTFNGTTVKETSTEHVTRDSLHAQIKQTTGSKSFTINTYFINEIYYECVEDNGLKCYEFPKLPEPNDQTPQIPAGEVLITELPARTIAGVSVSCFEIRPQGVMQIVCYSDDAIQLYLKVTSPEGSFERTVTQYKKTVPDSAFDLPTTPQPLPE